MSRPTKHYMSRPTKHYMKYTVKPVYKGHSIKGTWKCGFYVQDKIICTIPYWGKGDCLS